MIKTILLWNPIERINIYIISQADKKTHPRILADIYLNNC